MRVGEIDGLGAFFGVAVRSDGEVEAVLADRRELGVEGNHAPVELEAHLLDDGFGQFDLKAGQLGAVEIVERIVLAFGGDHNRARILDDLPVACLNSACQKHAYAACRSEELRK